MSDPAAQEVAVSGSTAWRLERIARLEDAREHWDRLAEGAGHPFATWEWIHTWWRFFGSDKELYTFLCTDTSGAAVAILPLYVATTRPIRVARFLGYGSLGSPLCAPEHRAEAAAALKATTGRGRDRCRMLYLEKLPGGEGWGEALGGRLLAEHIDPVIELDGRSWDEYLATRKRRLRGNIRADERRLQRDHELSFRLSEDPDRLAADIETMFRLHRAHWGEETTGVFEGPRAEMHRELAAELLARGWLRLWFEEIDGEAVAASYGFRYAGAEWAYQLGRVVRPELRSVGSVIVAHMIREACNDGVRTVRLLEGGSEFKLRLATGSNQAESRLIGDGVVGGLAGMAVAAARSVPDPVRARLMRFARRT